MKNLKIVINSDNPNSNEFLIISSKLGKVPNRVVLHEEFIGVDFLEEVGEESDIISSCEVIPKDDGYLINERILSKIGEDIWCSYLKLDRDSDNFIINNVCFYYGSGNEVFTIIERLTECSIEKESNPSDHKINNLIVSSGILDVDPVHYEDVQIKEYHQKKIQKDILSVISYIEKDDRGITILRGPRGSGKTYLSRFISQNSDSTSVSIPLNLIDLTINNPEFKNFLKRFRKSLIIIDDCEYNYSFNKTRSYLTGNILQAVETIDSNIHFILIFNVNGDYEIDDDLTNSHKLLKTIELDLLSPSEANDLSKKLGHDIDYNDNVSLSRVILGKKIGSKGRIGLN